MSGKSRFVILIPARDPGVTLPLPGVACGNASPPSILVFAGIQLVTAYGGATAISAEVPSSLYAKPGHYPIEILNKDSGLRSPAVYFDVK
jgi:hypothetical protein